MDRILVRATINALGLRRGDEAYVDLGPTADAMVEQGHWIWLDAPVVEPEHVTMTEAVKARKPRAKKVEDEAPVEDPVHVDYMNWADEGGYLPGDGTDARVES